MQFRKTAGFKSEQGSLNEAFDLDLQQQQEEHEIQALELELDEIENWYTQLDSTYKNKIEELYYLLAQKTEEYKQVREQLQKIQQESIAQKQQIEALQANQQKKQNIKKSPSKLSSFRNTEKPVEPVSDKNTKKTNLVNSNKGPSPKKLPTTFSKPTFIGGMSNNLKGSSPTDKSQKINKKSISPTHHQNSSSPLFKEKKKESNQLKFSQPNLPLKNSKKKGLDFFKEKMNQL